MSPFKMLATTPLTKKFFYLKIQDTTLGFKFHEIYEKVSNQKTTTTSLMQSPPSTSRK